jgi:hypothetical protein
VKPEGSCCFKQIFFRKYGTIAGPPIHPTVSRLLRPITGTGEVFFTRPIKEKDTISFSNKQRNNKPPSTKRHGQFLHS